MGPSYRIPVTDDFTRLTLDTIALCSMGYRFNSYYSETTHPFLTAMADFLIESGRRANRPRLANMVMRGTQQKYDADIKLLQETATEVLRNRKANPEKDKKDLLNAMIYGRDPQTGEGLTDQSIMNNMITFLIAGTCCCKLLAFRF
jgi:cytochrome P450/NADPH-cytochrome P450 reductase